MNGAPNAKLAAICNAARILRDLDTVKLQVSGRRAIYRFNNKNGFGIILCGTGNFKIENSGKQVEQIGMFGFKRPRKAGCNSKIMLDNDIVYLLSPEQITVE